jgi:addiction module RelB/DinJ family antitoxin
MHVTQTRSALLKGGLELAEIARISISCDKELKESAEEIFKILGLSTNAAVKLFLQAVVREQGVPFRMDVRDMRGTSPEPNERMMQHG